MAMYKYINTQNMASDQTKVLNTIAKYNYNTEQNRTEQVLFQTCT